MSLMNSLIFSEQIGSGTFSSVFRGTWINRQQKEEKEHKEPKEQKEKGGDDDDDNDGDGDGMCTTCSGSANRGDGKKKESNTPVGYHFSSHSSSSTADIVDCVDNIDSIDITNIPLLPSSFTNTIPTNTMPTNGMTLSKPCFRFNLMTPLLSLFTMKSKNSKESNGRKEAKESNGRKEAKETIEAKQVAIKVISSTVDRSLLYLNELDILIFLRKYADPFSFVQLLDTIKMNNIPNYAIDKIRTCLVFEYMNGGSLEQALANYNQSYSHHELTQMCYQILFSIYELHTAGIIHRDLKPANLMVQVDHRHRIQYIKIGDFGWACPADPAVHEGPKRSYITTRWYRAPELLVGTTEYSTAIDIWSLGCIFWELWLRQPLFETAVRKAESKDESSVRQLVMIGSLLGSSVYYQFDHHNGHNGHNKREVNESMRKIPLFRRTGFLSKHGLRIPFHPLSFAEYAEQRARESYNRESYTHRSIGQLNRIPPEPILDLLQHMLVYNPDHRWTAYQLLMHPVFDVIRKDDKLELDIPVYRPRSIALDHRNGHQEQQEQQLIISDGRMTPPSATVEKMLYDDMQADVRSLNG